MSFNAFLKLIFTSTLPLGSKTDYKRENYKDNIICLALFKCKTSFCLSGFFSQKWIMFINYILDALLIKLNHGNKHEMRKLV